MPELPDVEVMLHRLDSEGLGRRIAAVEPRDPLVLRGLEPTALVDALVGRKLVETARRGKWLFARIEDGPWLLIHFGMTGNLRFTGRDGDPPPYSRVELLFADGGSMHFVDQRRFGRVGLVSDVEDFAAQKRLGPDALDPRLSSAAFADRIRRRRGPVKGLLLDQSFVAGIGNIYGDEICHHARISPFARVEELTPDEIARLYRATRSVLLTAIEREAGNRGFPKSWLITRREKGAPCPDCPGTLARRRFQGRYTYWCPGCIGR